MRHLNAGCLLFLFTGEGSRLAAKLGIRVFVLIASIGAGVAVANPTTYTIKFTGNGSPTGGFTYDPDTSTFTFFTVTWNSLVFDLTSSANAPTILGSMPSCPGGSPGGAASFSFLKGQCAPPAPGFISEWAASGTPGYSSFAFLTGNPGPPLVQFGISSALLTPKGVALYQAGGWVIEVAPGPAITPGGIGPANSAVNTIQPGEWVSIFGANLAGGTTTWNGSFMTSLGGTSVTINGRAAYLSYVSPTQINLQSPDDTTSGPVHVVVTTGNGTFTSAVTLAPFAPSFLLLDSKHVAAIILRPNGSGAYGGGTYDIVGPTGSSLGYATVAAKAGDSVVLFAVGLGPTSPSVPSGRPFSGAAPTTNPVSILINNVSVTPSFAGLSSAGLYQINLTIPSIPVTGDVALLTNVGGTQTPSGVVISLQ